MLHTRHIHSPYFESCALPFLLRIATALEHHCQERTHGTITAGDAVAVPTLICSTYSDHLGILDRVCPLVRVYQTRTYYKVILLVSHAMGSVIPVGSNLI